MRTTIGASIHKDLRSLLRHLSMRLVVRYGLAYADLSALQKLVDWMDDTPKARRALKSLGVQWQKSRKR